MREALLELAAEAMRLAKAAGADEVAAGASRHREVAWTFRDGRLDRVKDATSRGLSVALYVQGRYASHTTSDLRPASLQAFLQEAVAMTRALQPDPHRALPEPALYATDPPALDLVDPTLAALDRDTRLQWLTAMDEAARADSRVLSAECEVSDDDQVSAYVTSNGFSGTSAATSAWISASATVRDEGDRRPEGDDWSGGHFLADLGLPADMGRGARERALSRIGAAKGPSGRATMVVDPRAGGNLVSRLLSAANGRALQQQQSFYAGKLGQRVVSERLTLHDDPLVPRGLSSRPYDGEGLKATRRALFEGGVLQNVYTDTYYARKAGLPVTTGSASNRVFALGDKALTAWIADVGTGIYVTSWLGGNSDSSTGDFSLGLRGFRIEGGRLGAPVGEMNVTGNLLDLFSSLVGVGNDPFRYGSIAAPTLVFEGVNFAGA